MPTRNDRCGCISMQDCHHPLCEYQEPHRHSFACDKACGCGGRGYDVIDPENHPNHVEWKMQRDHERRPVMPTTTDRCTCPTASAVCDGRRLDCGVHGDVDAILASGRYKDRRGRRWTETEPHGMWFDWEAIMRIDHSRMRLLIVRDLHREIGCSPRDCKFHPVPVVAKVWGDGWFASRPGCRNEEIYPTLAEAFAAAERLVTGENR